MTKNAPLSRPAATAIAAFLVLSTPHALAQSTPSDMASPPTIADPVMVPPVAPTTVPAPTMTAPVVTPQPTTPVIRVPLDIDPVAEPVAKATAEPVAKKMTGANRSVATDTRNSGPATPVLAAEAPATPRPETMMEPIAPVAPVADAQAMAARDTAQASNNLPWQIVGGAAALLLVGGAGVAFARRRRSSDVVEPVVQTQRRSAAQATRAPTVADIPAYILREEQQMAKPRTSPAFSAAPTGSMGRHEAMALAGPSTANPFITLRKRLKRARFHDRMDRVAYDATLADQKDMRRKPVSAWEIAHRPALAPAEQSVYRPSPASSFPSGLRPGFAGDR